MNTKEQVKAMLPIIQAWIDGKEIQYLSHISPHRGWQKYIPEESFSLLNSHPSYQWRIKPEKKTGWVVIGKCGNLSSSHVYSNFKFAKLDHPNALAIVQISYEEGEGLV